MVLKYLNLKYSVLTIVVFISMYTMIAYKLYGNIDSNNKTLNILSSPIEKIFGESRIVDNKLEISLDEIGVALVLFPEIKFDSKDFSQLDLQVNNLPENYHIKLVIIQKDIPEPIELSLLQPDGEGKSNYLVFDDNWIGNIDLIGLRFLPQDELGIAEPIQKPIIVEQALFNNDNFFQNYFTLFEYWTDYEPWTYLSISHLMSSEKLPYYAQPVVFIMIGTIICLILCFLIYRKVLYIMPLLLAWAFLDVLFLHNLNTNANWVNAIYGSESKPLPDDELYNMSMIIKNDFGNYEDLLKMKDIKLYILTLNKYDGIRLTYHLLPLNVGFWGTQLPGSVFKDGDYILSYGTPENRILPSNGQLTQNEVIVNINEISSGLNYNLMRVTD